MDMFYRTYGRSAETTRELLKGVHSDFGTPPPFPAQERSGAGLLMEKDYFLMSLIYGPVNAFAGILEAPQTSFVMISALVAIDAPLQTGWHEKGTIRNGASDEYVKAVKRIAEMCVERIGGNARAKPGSSDTCYPW
jgi:hypothetical protein